MAHTPHELAEEFPEYTDRIHDLKINNAHFARLFDEYHEINRKIHRIETEIEPASDEHTETLKKKRLLLKDEVAELLSGKH